MITFPTKFLVEYFKERTREGTKKKIKNQKRSLSQIRKVGDAIDTEITQRYSKRCKRQDG